MRGGKPKLLDVLPLAHRDPTFTRWIDIGSTCDLVRNQRETKPYEIIFTDFEPDAFPILIFCNRLSEGILHGCTPMRPRSGKGKRCVYRVSIQRGQG